MSKIAVQSRASRFPERRAQRRKDAADRLVISSAMTPEQRLASLDKIFGVGAGATKERLKLHAKITQAAAAAQVVVVVEKKKAEKKSKKQEAEK